MKQTLFRVGRIAAVIAAGPALALAQGTQTASVTGQVTDAAGAPISGVQVRLSSPSLQGVRVVMSDASGNFITRLLPPGTYSVELIKDGFQTSKFTQVLGIDQNYQPRVILPKSQDMTVEVVGTASPLVDKTDPKTAVNYNLSRIDTIPTGRSLDSVALLTPGVTAGVGGRVQIRGAMTSGNAYLVDGQNVADNAYNNSGVQLINDSLEELQVITGAISAEYGDVDGGVINAITKSGSNEFEGQLRWALTDPSWNAVVPYQDRNGIQNKLSEIKTLTVGGPIIKDKLWFSGAYYRTNSFTSGSISTNSVPQPNGAGAAFTGTLNEIRRQFKLTYSLNEDHTLVFSFANSQNAQGNRNYSAGELAALVPQTNTSEFWNLDWRALWASNFTTDIRVGAKKQRLSAGATNESLSPIYDYNRGLFYNNGIFNSHDGGDNRNNKTAGAKGTLFVDRMGTHQIDFGVDYRKDTSKSRNDQSVTGLIFGTVGVDIVAQTAQGIDVWTYQSASGEATNESLGFYANDKWAVNQHLAVQVGARFDRYKAVNDKGDRSAGASGFSPRLGMKYDLLGDGKWVLGASYARYNAKVQDGIVNQVTNQGNPTEIDYDYIGPAGNQPYSVIYDLNNYDFTSPSYYNNPALNVRLSDHLKAPSVDEYQLQAAYSFNNPTVGQGFVSLTGVQKKWHNLIDYRVGNDGTVLTPLGAPVYVKIWENSDIAVRKYRGLELAAQLTHGDWFVTGNITWSKLEGNYEGEGSSTPARGEGLKSFTTQDGVVMYDNSVTAPYGYLAGHVPIRMRWQADRAYHTSFGTTTVGFVYNFNSGAHYSDTRTISRARLNPALSTQFGTTATQYKDGVRGAKVLPGVSTLDFAITQEWELFKVATKPVNGFVKFIAYNVFNHQQITGWNTVSAAATGPSGTGTTSPWVYPAAYGTSTTAGSWGGANAGRAYSLDLGFRF
ncbi:MAG TPA: TonB-dependent receptor [Holophagaceae bacterium]|nr:TonB-dependent receptor [Holophagaceae bacterium]